MGKSLVIVESPAKAKTINRYLGDSYVVASSVGHVRDLPRGASKFSKKGAKNSNKDLSAEQKLFNRMGVDPTRNWEARYEILEDKTKVIKDLIQKAKQSDTVYLATDMDREGEAIAWHLSKVLQPKKLGAKDKPIQFKRVIFNEITRDAIQQAFDAPGEINLNSVRAQQARRFLDRVVGFMLSPLLWTKVARNLSAGRVQSVATRLVVEREDEINTFMPDEYWEIYAYTKTDKDEPLTLQVKKYQQKEFKPDNQKDAEKALATLQSLTPFTLSNRTEKAGQTRPYPPLITSTLQQAASARLGFGVKKTMFLAQRLYEAGHISYTRTDSTHLSKDAIESCRAYISFECGAKYLPAKAHIYSSASGAQEAHEAIRPTRVDVKAETINIPRAQRDAQRLYELIWRYFVACQMMPMRYKTLSLIVATGDYELRASGRVILFDGFTKILLPAQKSKDKNKEGVLLPDIKEGATLSVIDFEKTQHFTRYPARYSEATLVKEMEKLGIGRPSTYASVISTIQDRGYVTLQNKRMHSEKIGDIVTKRLMENFQDLMDYNFTASMEVSLDKIAKGESMWRDVLDEFYKNFVLKLEKAKMDMRANEPIVVNDISCPSCNRPMCLRTGQTGVFLGCSGYQQAPSERCKKTINLHPLEDLDAGEGDSEGKQQSQQENQPKSTSKRCSKCDRIMRAYVIDKERCIHVCSDIPDCPTSILEHGNFPMKSYQGPELKCDRCSAPMELRDGRFGRYFSCTAEECSNTRKMLPSGEPAPPKMPPVPMTELRCIKVDDHYLLRDGATGLFLSASQFPRHRETRSPLVEELIPYRDKIDKKYHYLLDAPVVDKDGNKAEIRYSRKNSIQYISTRINGKPTGWQAFHRDGEWHEEQTTSKQSSKNS